MSTQTHHLYEFGPFRLDRRERVLLREGELVPLTPKAMETLLVLVQNNGHVLEKDELLKEIWPDTFVEEATLAQNIFTLRKALGNGKNNGQHYIETVPKRGYRFIADVIEVMDEPSEPESEQAAFDSAEAPERVPVPADESIRLYEQPLALYQAPAKARGEKKMAAILVMAFIALFGITYIFLLRDKVAPAPYKSINVTRFTATGKTIDAAISPDGKYVAYVVNDAAKQSLWIKQVATPSNVQIIPPADVSYQGLSFSSDSNYIYYNLWDKNSVGAIYQVPVLGGVSKRIIYDVLPSISVSPDGKHIAFIRGYAAESKEGLIIANIDGTEEQSLSTSACGEWVNYVAWSPDGKSLACAVGSVGNKGVSYMQLCEMPIDGSAGHMISPQKWPYIGEFEWLRSGDGLMMIALDQEQSEPQIWFVPYPGGEARKLTSEVTGYRGLSLTADSSTLVTVQEDVYSNVWVAPSDDFAKSRKITSGRIEGIGVCWTPDGRIVYVSRADGNPDIWIMDQDGSNRKQLTSDPGIDIEPSVSSDGRYIVFFSNRAGRPHIWRMDIDGRNQMQLTTGSGEWSPNCSAESPWVVYNASETGHKGLWKMAVEGGPPVKLTTRHSSLPAISPDGKRIAYSYWDEDAHPQQWAREIISIDGEQKPQPFSLPSTAVGSTGDVPVRWSPDGRSLTYIDNRGGISNLWSRPLDGGPPRPLTAFRDNQIFCFDWSPDGKSLVYAQGVKTSDVVLMKNFK